MNIKPAVRKPLGLLLALTGIVLVAVILATTLTADHTTKISVTSRPDSNSAFVYTAPGVLDLVNSKVEVTAQAEGETIFWAIGEAYNVQAYIGDSQATEITGLSSWEEFSTDSHGGTPEQAKADAAAVKDGRWSLGAGDMWLKQGSGKNEVSLKYEVAEKSNPEIVLTTSQGHAPTVTFSWYRVNTPNSPLPYVTIALVVFLAGLVLLISESKHDDGESVSEQRNDLSLHADRDAQTEIMPRVQGSGADGIHNSDALENTHVTVNDARTDTGNSESMSNSALTTESALLGTTEDSETPEASPVLEIPKEPEAPAVSENIVESHTIEQVSASYNSVDPERAGEYTPSDHEMNGEVLAVNDADPEVDDLSKSAGTMPLAVPKRRRRHGTVYQHTQTISNDDSEGINA